MQPPRHYRSTRRSIIASSLGLLLPLQQASALDQSSTPQASPEASRFQVDLGDGIAVTDFRMIPDVEPARFLIEIQSSREDDVDSPVTGLYTPGETQADSFTWADPWLPVLRAGSSTFATGLLPYPEMSPEQMTWVVCGDSVESGAKTSDQLDWEWEAELEIELVGANALRLHTVVTNSGPNPIRGAAIYAQIRDDSGRICGGAPTVPTHLAPNESISRTLGFSAGWNSTVNPFHLVDDNSKMRVEIELQPAQSGISRGCPAIMPWNRDD